MSDIKEPRRTKFQRACQRFADERAELEAKLAAAEAKIQSLMEDLIEQDTRIGELQDERDRLRNGIERIAHHCYHDMAAEALDIVEGLLEDGE